MSKFNALTVKSIRQLTADAVEINFDVPSELSDYYAFEHGQFVVLRKMIDDELVERAYSVCRAPYERQLSVAVKHVDQGVFSSYATNEIKDGDVIDVSAPSGTFTCSLDSSETKRYLFIAAGSGITPIMSIIKMVLASEPQSQCILMYGNKEIAYTMFLSELVALKERYQEQLQIEWMFSQETPALDVLKANGLLQANKVHQGRIDQAFVEKIADKECLSSMAMVFLCGPEKMTLSLREYCLEQGLPSDSLKVELFSATNPINNVVEGDMNAAVSLLIDGEELEVVYDDPTESILEHALRVDPDLPYGCQNGSCGVCQAKLVSGRVSMTVNYALSDSEVEEGYVLLCQAHPESKKIVISYDE